MRHLSLLLDDLSVLGIFTTSILTRWFWAKAFGLMKTYSPEPLCPFIALGCVCVCV